MNQSHIFSFAEIKEHVNHFIKSHTLQGYRINRFKTTLLILLIGIILKLRLLEYFHNNIERKMVQLMH